MKRFTLVAMLAMAVMLSGCATLQQMAALRHVAFRFDRIADVSLAGVPIGPGADYSKVGLTDLARLTAALAEGRAPLRATAHVAATNPADNSVAARMTALSWTLFVDERRTVGGGLASPVEIAPGATTDVPLGVELDLMEFWEGGARDLFDVAVGIAGGTSGATPLRLELVPTIETALGPIRYAVPISVRR